MQFEQNSNLGLGAGVLAVSGQSEVALSHSAFTDNFIENQMGLVGPDVLRASCITADAAVVSAAHSVFESNTGGNVISAGANAVLDLAHTVFRSNDHAAGAANVRRRRLASSGQTDGAVIALVDGSVAHVSDATFISNIGLSAGAIIVADAGTAIFLDRVKFTTNTATAPDSAGGALHVSGGATVRGSQTVFESNSAASQLAGGAIFASSGADIILTDSTLTANTASPHPEDGGLYGAGAVYTQQAHLQLIGTAVQDNTAAGGDAVTASNFADGLYIQSPLTIKVKDSSFAPLLWGGKSVSINPQVLEGQIMQGGCQQHPCAIGSSCSYANYSLSCQDCPGQTVGQDGISCSMVKGPTYSTHFCFFMTVFVWRFVRS